MFKTDKETGINLINGVMSEFKNMIDKLEKGKELLTNTRKVNSDKIDLLLSENKIIHINLERAEKLQVNINKLLE